MSKKVCSVSATSVDKQSANILSTVAKLFGIEGNYTSAQNITVTAAVVRSGK